MLEKGDRHRVGCSVACHSPCALLAQVACMSDIRSILEMTDWLEEILWMTCEDEAWSLNPVEMTEPGAPRWIQPKLS
jgi:hypothetical protein